LTENELKSLRTGPDIVAASGDRGGQKAGHVRKRRGRLPPLQAR
jgi:hypothetical protein